MNKPDVKPVEAAQRILAFAVCYFLLAIGAAYLAHQVGQVATIWLANSLGIAFLVASKKSLTPALLLAAAGSGYLAHWAFGDPALRSLAFAPASLIEMWLAATLLRKTDSLRLFADSPQDFLRFLFAASVIPALPGATIGALSLWLLGGSDLPQIWATRYAGSIIGSVGLLPVAFLCIRQGAAPLGKSINWPKATLWGTLSLCVGIPSLMYLPYPFVYIMAPLTISAVMMNFESVALLVCFSVLTTGGTIASGNFPAAIHFHDHMLQIYLPFLLTIVPPMLMAAGMNQSRLKEGVRQSVEEALQRSHQDLQTIIDHTPAMIGYWDHELKNRFSNRAYVDWFGMDPDKLRNMHIRDVVGEERYALNLPYIEAVLRGESPVFERTITDTKGHLRHTLASYVPDTVDGEIRGFYAFVNDITSLKEAQQDQSAARAQLQSIIDAASEFSIIATDRHGTIRVFSPGAERMLGYRADEIVGSATPALLHLPRELATRGMELSQQLGRPLKQFEIFSINVGKDKADVHEWTYRRKDGSCLPVRLVVTAILDEHGKVTGYLGIANDISGQRQLQWSLVQAKEQAEAASRAKSEFVANMSHEIRTPMNAVLGMAHLLENTELTTDQRNYLGMIRDSGRSLLSILNDILDFSKIEAGRMDLSVEPFELGDVLNALATIMTVNAGEKDLELAIGIGADVPKQMIGDALRLQQILINLAGNAIKFTEQGEVAVSIELDYGLAVHEPDTVGLRFCITDTGIGMDHAQQERIFAAFSQADSSTTRRFGGTGLGLAICKRLVTLMGGSMQLRSEVGVGSEFRVTLPMKFVAPDALPDNRHGKQFGVLVIDDSGTSRDYIARTIEALNWRVDCAASGAEGIALVMEKSRTKRPYDMVLVDWQMPGMDGIVTMKAIRDALPEAAPHMVIMVSAFGRGKLLGEKMSRQADAVLVKPVTESSLLAILQDSQIGPGSAPRARTFEPYRHHLKPGIDGARILLVEDNHLNQVVAQSMLVQAGAIVDVLDNGLEAVQRMAARGADYDLILMDVQMPVMDGCSAAIKIREELHLSLPILAMTAGVMATEQAHCKASGMNDFIPKPINVDQMFSAIARYLPLHTQEKLQPESTAFPLEVPLPATAPSRYFNPAPVLQVGEGDAAFRKQIIGLIHNAVASSPAQFREARDACQAGKGAESAALLHAMRSPLGALGAKEFATATVEIEKAIRAGATDLVEALFQVAETNLNQTMAEARLWLADQEGKDQATARNAAQAGIAPDAAFSFSGHTQEGQPAS